MSSAQFDHYLTPNLVWERERQRWLAEQATKAKEARARNLVKAREAKKAYRRAQEHMREQHAYIIREQREAFPGYRWMSKSEYEKLGGGAGC